MNRYAVHNEGRALFVDIRTDRSVEVQIGERTYGQFQKIVISRDDAAELAAWLVEEIGEPS